MRSLELEITYRNCPLNKKMESTSLHVSEEFQAISICATSHNMQIFRNGASKFWLTRTIQEWFIIQKQKFRNARKFRNPLSRKWKRFLHLIIRNFHKQHFQLLWQISFGLHIIVQKFGFAACSIKPEKIWRIRSR